MDEENKEENIHPVITLLVKRMESNPEEFKEGRWSWVDTARTKHFNAEEVKVYNAGLRKLYMQELHEKVMEQILDPGADGIRYREDLFAQQQKVMAQQYQNALKTAQGLQGPTPVAPKPQPLTPYQQMKKLLEVP